MCWHEQLEIEKKKTTPPPKKTNTDKKTILDETK